MNMFREKVRKSAPAYVILFVLLCLPAAARAEQVLKKGRASYLGWAMQTTFRTCAGSPIEIVPGGNAKETSRRCSNEQVAQENDRRKREHSPLALLTIDPANPVKTADVVDYVSASQLEAYVNGRQTEDAFRAAGLWLEAYPDDIQLMLGLTGLAAAEAAKGNGA